MSTEPQNKPRLSPARPALEEEAASYMPRIPWRYLLIGGLSIATVMAGYWLKERSRAEGLRNQIMSVYGELEEPARRYLEFRDEIEKLVLSTAGKAPDGYVEKRLHIPGLRSGRGLYLRVSADATQSVKALRQGATALDGDVIASCMGLAPTNARGLWEQGEFLTPEWIEKTKGETSVMHLRVTDEVLARKMRTDLPAVLNMIRSDWFLLIVEQGGNRRDAPVDAYLWDLRHDKELLRARVKADGVLLPVRVRSEGTPAAPRLRPEDLDGSGSVDCSIASKIKELAGAKAAEIANVPVLEAPVAQAPATEQSAAAAPGSDAPAPDAPAPSEPPAAPEAAPGAAEQPAP